MEPPPELLKHANAAREAPHATRLAFPHGTPSLNRLTKSMEVRDRLQAVKKRSTALGADPTNWDENQLKR